MAHAERSAIEMDKYNTVQCNRKRRTKTKKSEKEEKRMRNWNLFKEKQSVNNREGLQTGGKQKRQRNTNRTHKSQIQLNLQLPTSRNKTRLSSHAPATIVAPSGARGRSITLLHKKYSAICDNSRW